MKKSLLRSTLVKVSAAMLILATVVLIFYFSAVVSEFVDSIELSTQDFVELKVDEAVAEINGVISSQLASYKSGLAQLNGVDDFAVASERLSIYHERLVSNEGNGVVDMRFFKDGKEFPYNAMDNKHDYNYSEAADVLELVELGIDGCTGSVYESESKENKCIAFCIRVKDSNIVDCVVIKCKLERLFSELNVFKDDATEELELACLAASGGQVVRQYMAAETFSEFENTNNLLTLLQEASKDKEALDFLMRAVSDGGTESITVEIKGESYALAFGAAKVNVGKLFIAEAYKPSVIFSYSYLFTSKLGGTVVMLVIIFIIMLIVILAVRNYYKNQLYKSDNIDPLLDCRSFKKFTIDYEDIISTNRTSAYALICMSIDTFAYIKAQYGDGTATDLLKFLGKLLDKYVRQNETYGHIIDEKFVIMLRYNDKDELLDRLKLIGALLSGYPELKNKNYNARVIAGIREIPRNEKNTMQELLDQAMLAQMSKHSAESEQFVFYTDDIGEQSKKERLIEGKMEAALQNHEFKVFYQPKINIVANRLDGAEALVRWYDYVTKTYVSPAEFVPLFERNGFITKVDRYVYEEVCKFIHDSVLNEQRIVQVSVNVSRVTATEKGFVEFYTALKRKYKIANGYLMIEFTESFAQENYNTLNSIVSQLHANGFLCSIDDFGSGYSSHSILKELPMDELKLDSFFIRPGVSKEKDDILLQSIIKLGKDLGMKVTQEGVETYADVQRLKAMGCTVIQGYYFAKPMIQSDYINFASNNFISAIKHNDDE